MPGHTANFSRIGGIIILAAVALLTGCSREDEVTPASDTAAAELPGQRIAQDLCAGCHAIGLEDASPHADAPPFRTLSEKYPVRYLEEALAEGIAVGHEDMPEFQLEADEVEQLIVYLESIQAK